MKKIKLIIFAIATSYSVNVIGGNEDRAGEAGASQMLINPWTSSVGWGGANTSSINGSSGFISNSFALIDKPLIETAPC